MSSPTVSIPNIPQARAPPFTDYLRFSAAVATAIEAYWGQLQHRLADLTTALEAGQPAELYAPLPRLPDAPTTPQVEMV
jgi:hypothetical protein